MLLHGIQELRKKIIILPKREVLWPDQVKLEVRYNRFIKEGYLWRIKPDRNQI